MASSTQSATRRIALAASLVVTGAFIGTIATLILVDGRSEGPSETDRQSGNAVSETKTPEYSESSMLAESQQTDSPINRSDVREIPNLSGLESDFSRSVALFNLLQKADEPTLRDLIRQSKSVTPASQRRNIQKAVFRRFAGIDPIGALTEIEQFETYLQGFLIEAVFREWSLLDLDGAVVAAKQLQGMNKRAAIRAILTTRDDLSQEMRRQLAVQMGNEELGLAMINDSRKYEAIDNPAQTWNEVLEDSIENQFQSEFLVRIAEEWIERDGIQILGQVMDSISDLHDRHNVLSPVLGAIAALDPHGAMEQALTLSHGNRMFALNVIAQAWAEMDGQQALEAISSIPSGSIRRQTQEVAIRTWGYQDPKGLIQKLQLVPENLVELANQTAILTIARNDPEEAANLMKTVENRNSQTSIMWGLVHEWAGQDTDAALNWVLSQTINSNQRADLIGVVLRPLSMDDPQRAMDLALKQSTGSTGRGLETVVIAELAYRDADTAIELLPRVREPFALEAYVTVGSALVYSHNPQRALKLGEQLNEVQRHHFFVSVIRNWSHHAPESLFDDIETLPSDELKSEAAKMIVSNNSWSKTFTDVQIRHARTFLTDKDRDELDRLLQ